MWQLGGGGFKKCNLHEIFNYYLKRRAFSSGIRLEISKPKGKNNANKNSETITAGFITKIGKWAGNAGVLKISKLEPQGVGKIRL